MQNGQMVHLPSHETEFRRCLVDCDIEAIKRLWAHVAPSMPQSAQTDEEVLTCIHIARTAVEKLPFRFRAYSHKWLTERGYPSQLPDKLKPKAERMYPRTASAVGICVASFSNKKTDYHKYVQAKLADVVENSYADGMEDPDVIKKRMKEVHDICRKQR